jgi:Tfp pilus assembly protein PilX
MMQRMHPHQGPAFPTSMVMLTLASLATLLAMRHLWVNDQLLNAEADQMRTQQHAQGVLPLAVQDILGTAATPLRHTMGSPTDSHVFFPNTLADYSVLQQRLGTANCQQGICVPATAPSPANATLLQKASSWKQQTPTAIAIGAADSPDGAHSACYWVEVFVEENTGELVYRITALAQGFLPGSTSVVQALWKRTSPAATTGQWLSWRVLRD